MAIDPTATTVEPKGLARTLLVVTLFFPLPVTFAVFLRCIVRFRHRTLGVDDGLMLVGWVLYMV